MTVADRIKSTRESLGLTQEQLALRMGYTGKSSVSKIEISGNDITLKKVSRVAKALGVSPSFLMGWTNEDDDSSKQIIDPEKEARALELYEKYLHATPEIQKAIERILKADE